MLKSGGKKIVVFRQISKKKTRCVSIICIISIIQPFQVQIERFQNLLNKAKRKGWMLGYFKCSKY